MHKGQIASKKYCILGCVRTATKHNMLHEQCKETPNINIMQCMLQYNYNIPYLGLHNAHWCIMRTPSWP
jgi:hypothetical protein